MIKKISLVAAVNTKKGRKTILVQADVTDQESVFAMRGEIVKTLGTPQIIVNNAVVQYSWTSVLDQAIDDYESQFQTSKKNMPYLFDTVFSKVGQKVSHFWGDDLETTW